MRTNALPHFDDSDNPTGCCPRFDPAGWDGQELHFRDKAFVRATTRSLLHVPIDMGKVFARVHGHLRESGAYDPDDFIVLSRELTPWQAEHLFAASRPVPQEETVRLSGDFITRVFEGPYRAARHWHEAMAALAREKRATAGKATDREETDREAEVYFFYTTCPRCAKAYGRNYVVGVARTG